MKNRMLAVLVAGELGCAALAWRDLDRRPAGTIRGPKRVWRVALLANPGNSLAYWALGRRTLS